MDTFNLGPDTAGTILLDGFVFCIDDAFELVELAAIT